MVMSASPSPSMSPSMVMPSVVIVSSPLCRNSTPPASDASNLIVSGSAAPLALASPSASRSERPLPSGAAGVSLPSNVSSASVVTVNSAMTAPPCHPRGDVSARLSARSPADAGTGSRCRDLPGVEFEADRLSAGSEAHCDAVLPPHGGSAILPSEDQSSLAPGEAPREIGRIPISAARRARHCERTGSNPGLLCRELPNRSYPLPAALQSSGDFVGLCFVARASLGYLAAPCSTGKIAGVCS
jgi:hypothetical protein